MLRNILFLLLLLPCFSNAFQGNKSIAIAYAHANKTFAFTANEMKTKLTSAGWKIRLVDINGLPATGVSLRIILTSTGSAAAPVAASPSVAQGYSLRKKERRSVSDWYVIGGDDAGTMYGGLDVADLIQYNGPGALTETDKTPYIKQRGIKFNIPLDSRTPSYTDNGDAALMNIANMWDINFWHEFLDELARDRYNMLSLWTLSPFPSLVDVPEYPRAALNDVKRTTDRPLPNIWQRHKATHT